MAIRQRKRSTNSQPQSEPLQYGMKQVTKTEKFLEPVQPPDQELNRGNQTIIQGFVPSDTHDAMGEDDIDDLEKWKDRIEEEQGLKLRVDRIKDYHLTGIWGKGAQVTYCGEFPVSKSSLLNDSYLQSIQSGYRGGAYRLQLRYANGSLIKTFLAVIDEPVTPPAAVPYAPTPNGNPVQGIIEQAELFNRLRAALFPDAPAVASAAASNPQKPPSLEERLLNIYLDKAAIDGDKTQLDKIVDRVLGKNESTDTWIQVIKEISAPMLPAIGQTIGNILERAANNYFSAPPIQATPGALPLPLVNPQATATALPSPGLIPEPQQLAPAPVAAPEWFNQDTDDPLINFFKKFRIDVLQDYPVDQFLESYFSFTEKHETLYSHVEFLVTQDPHEILRQISIAPTIQSIQYIQTFQRLVKEQIESTDETGGQDD